MDQAIATTTALIAQPPDWQPRSSCNWCQSGSVAGFFIGSQLDFKTLAAMVEATTKFPVTTWQPVNKYFLYAQCPDSDNSPPISPSVIDDTMCNHDPNTSVDNSGHQQWPWQQ